MIIDGPDKPKPKPVTSKSLAEEIMESLRFRPASWKFDSHYAICGKLDLWIANRPYADLTIGSDGPRIGTRWQRRKIRKMMNSIRYTRASEMLRGAPLYSNTTPAPMLRRA
jgi:hypothetical protein